MPSDHHHSTKQYIPIPNFKRFKFYFKMLDMYALPITLRYKHQKMFYTNFGAMISLLVYVAVFMLISN